MCFEFYYMFLLLFWFLEKKKISYHYFILICLIRKILSDVFVPASDCRLIPFKPVKFLTTINIPGQFCGCMLNKWCQRFVEKLMTFCVFFQIHFAKFPSSSSPSEESKKRLWTQVEPRSILWIWPHSATRLDERSGMVNRRTCIPQMDAIPVDGEDAFFSTKKGPCGDISHLIDDMKITASLWWSELPKPNVFSRTTSTDKDRERCRRVCEAHFDKLVFISHFRCRHTRGNDIVGEQLHEKSPQSSQQRPS